jgi:hypothetical protein
VTRINDDIIIVVVVKITIIYFCKQWAVKTKPFCGPLYFLCLLSPTQQSTLKFHSHAQKWVDYSKIKFLFAQHEGIFGVELYFHSSLTLSQDGGEWSTSCPSSLNPRERAVVPTE